MINQAKITDAIESAKAELQEIQEKLEQLRPLEQRAKQLEDFVVLGQILIGEGQGISSLTSSLPDTPLPKKILRPIRPVRKVRTVGTSIGALLEEKQQPMRLQEMTRELLKRKWVSGKWAREVIRNALNRGDEFERLAPGIYALKHWPDTLKRIPGMGGFFPHQDSAEELLASPNGLLVDHEIQGMNQSENHD